jgi:hypothetical protein
MRSQIVPDENPAARDSVLWIEQGVCIKALQICKAFLRSLAQAGLNQNYGYKFRPRLQEA